jgi:hypothetical protein
MNKEELRKFLIEKYKKPTYIGDSVYVHFDGYHFILETRNGLPDDPINTIGLEPSVIEIFMQYRENCYKDFIELKNEK